MEQLFGRKERSLRKLPGSLQHLRGSTGVLSHVRSLSLFLTERKGLAIEYPYVS